MAGSHLKAGMQLSIILCTKSPHTFELTVSPQRSLATGLGRNDTQRAHSILPSVFCVFPCNISSTAAHALLSKADGQIGDMKNLPTAIAWACPRATGDNWSEISDQAGEASEFTQLETVYTELCEKRPITLPSFVQSHSDAPRLVLSSKYSLICWEVFQLFYFLLPLTGALREKVTLFLPRMCRTWGGDTRCISPFASLTDGQLLNLLSQQWNTRQSPEGNGLEVFSCVLVSSGGRKINFCPYSYNPIAFNHSIWCKHPEIISKGDANLFSRCTNTLSMLTAPSCQLLLRRVLFLIHICSSFSELGCRTQQMP